MFSLKFNLREQTKQSNFNILLLDINDILFNTDSKEISLKDPVHLNKYGKDLDLSKTVIVLNKTDTKSGDISGQLKDSWIHFEFGKIPVVASISIKNDEGVTSLIDLISARVLSIEIN